MPITLPHPMAWDDPWLVAQRPASLRLQDEPFVVAGDDDLLLDTEGCRRRGTVWAIVTRRADVPNARPIAGGWHYVASPMADLVDCVADLAARALDQRDRRAPQVAMLRIDDFYRPWVREMRRLLSATQSRGHIYAGNFGRGSWRRENGVFVVGADFYIPELTSFTADLAVLAFALVSTALGLPVEVAADSPLIAHSSNAALDFMLDGAEDDTDAILAGRRRQIRPFVRGGSSPADEASLPATTPVPCPSVPHATAVWEYFTRHRAPPIRPSGVRVIVDEDVPFGVDGRLTIHQVRDHIASRPADRRPGA